MERCTPICWVHSDGGEALEQWKLARLVVRRDKVSGEIIVDWSALTWLAPASVQADPEARLELAGALQSVVAVYEKPPTDSLFPPDTGDDED